MVTLVIGDENDAPLWQSWSLSMSVDEGTSPKTLLGDDDAFVVSDPDADSS